MSTMKFTNPQHWRQIEDHLAGASGERFAFAFTRILLDRDDNLRLGPVLEVVDIALVGDADTEHDATGWYVSDQALDRVHNQAVVTGSGLAEFHNHCYGPPRFSPTDRAGLQPSAEYVLDLLPGLPYLAVVWAEGQVHAEWWATGTSTSHGTVDTVTVLGDQLRVLSAAPTDPTEELGGDSGGAGRFDRQLPLIGPAGQATVAALRVAVVGAGGTGSQVLLQLAYLGFGNVLVLDDDLVEVTNLNRLVTAGSADVGIAKTEAALRRLRAIDPLMRVIAAPGITVTGDHPELRDVDLIIGCVDHDGPRQRLNQIAVETSTPYLDVATGVDTSITPSLVGGRVALIVPGEPCLQCLGELDPGEVARWAKPADQQRLDRLHGYGTGEANPSVVHLNALTVSVAMAELVAWICGSRPPALWVDVDLTGATDRPGVRVAPRILPGRDVTCLACAPYGAAVGCRPC